MYITKRLNKVETRLLTVGDPFKCSSEVIVVITGSPGIPEFYSEFADQLHRCTQLPVCVIGKRFILFRTSSLCFVSTRVFGVNTSLVFLYL